MEFQFKCYFEQCNISEERWNYFKDNYEQMKKKLDLDWNKILTESNPNKLFNIFVEKFNKAKSECIPKIICKIDNKAKMHNYLPLDDKTITKLKMKHRAWQRYMESREREKYRKYVKLRNQVKNMIRIAKAVIEKDIVTDVKNNLKGF